MIMSSNIELTSFDNSPNNVSSNETNLNFWKVIKVNSSIIFSIISISLNVVVLTILLSQTKSQVDNLNGRVDSLETTINYFINVLPQIQASQSNLETLSSNIIQGQSNNELINTTTNRIIQNLNTTINVLEELVNSTTKLASTTDVLKPIITEYNSVINKLNSTLNPNPLSLCSIINQNLSVFISIISQSPNTDTIYSNSQLPIGCFNNVCGYSVAIEFGWNIILSFPTIVVSFFGNIYQGNFTNGISLVQGYSPPSTSQDFGFGLLYLNPTIDLFMTSFYFSTDCPYTGSATNFYMAAPSAYSKTYKIS